MHRPERPSHWTMTAIGMAVVIVTALATAFVVASWSGRTREVQPAALPAAVAELPPRTVVVSDGRVQTEAEPAPPVTGLPPKSVAEACDGEAVRAAGVTLATKKKMREIRRGEKYRAAYASCLRSSGYTS